jgi:RES domain
MATSPETAASRAAAGQAASAVAALAYAIAAVPLRGVTGTLCRAVRARHLKEKQPPEPLYYLASARTGARFTPVGGPAGLYLATDQPTAFAEIGDLRYDAAGAASHSKSRRTASPWSTRAPPCAACWTWQTTPSAGRWA